MSSATCTAMSSLKEFFDGNVSGMSVEAVNQINVSSVYEVAEFIGKSIWDLQETLANSSTFPEQLEEMSAAVIASGAAACILAISGAWGACKKLSRRKEHETISKRSLIESIKKAYDPEHAEAAIQQLNHSSIDVNEKLSTSGLTYFLCGCLSGNRDLIHTMLKLGGDVDSETIDGDSALYLTTYAIMHSPDPDIGALAELIRAGCSVNKQNRLGFTPLHRAASRGNIKVIQYLLSEGADPYIVNSAGVYPIDSAVCAGHTDAARLLKLKFPSAHVWDVVDPHTPPHIKMGLQSPQRKLLLASSRATAGLRNVFT